jgi:hypothetical protein
MVIALAVPTQSPTNTQIDIRALEALISDTIELFI